MSTEEPLRVGRWNSSQWVTGAQERKIPSQIAGGSFERGTRRYDDLRSRDPVPQRDAYSWTALISQQVKCGKVRQALRTYEEMQECGVQPSSYTYVAALKACSGLQDLETVKKLHAQVVASGFQSVVNVGNILVAAYAKSGSLIDARHVFDNMHNRNVVSWTAMILGYAQMEEGREALQLYKRMRQERVVPNERTFVAALKACSSLTAMDDGNVATRIVLRKQCLEQVKAIHSDVVTSGSESAVYVTTMLVDAYAKCGSLVDARRMFENMPYRDVVSWNAMILGYAQMEQGEQALQLFSRMQKEDVEPNDRTFVAALKACTSLVGFADGSEADLRKLCLDQVRAIGAQVVKTGFESAVFVGNMLLDVYAKCGSLVEARSVFEKMPHRTVVSWNAMILGYAQVEMGKEALQLYAQMQDDGVVPDDRTFVAALKACSSLVTCEEAHEGHVIFVKEQCMEQVRCIHSRIVEMGVEADVFVGTMLVDAFAKCGSLGDARHVFEQMPHRNVVSWNAMILGYAHMNEGDEALQLFARMQQEGMVPDARTFVAALKACCNQVAGEERIAGDTEAVKSHCLEQVRRLHSDIVGLDIQADVYVVTMLVDVYVKCGSIADARSAFENMPHQNVESWNAMILGYAQMEKGVEALQMFTRMQQEGVVPDSRTFVAALKACGVVAGLEKGKEIHLQISNCGLDATGSFMATSLIDMYGKCGSMESAQQVFDAMLIRDVVTWNALLLGYAHQGESELVFGLFQRMQVEGIQPDRISFLSVLMACCHAGLVDEGKQYFKTMIQDYDITPNIDHFTCVVDLFGRAGHLDEAMTMTKVMPFQPDSVVWQTVLSACRKWLNVEVGRQAFASALSLDKNDAAAYVLMSNIYADSCMWKDAKEIQAMRVKRQAWKQAGQTWWTDVGGIVHAFLAGDHDRLESQDVHLKLQYVFVRMKEEGAHPGSMLLLGHDIDKSTFLWAE